MCYYKLHYKYNLDKCVRRYLLWMCYWILWQIEIFVYCSYFGWSYNADAPKEKTEIPSVLYPPPFSSFTPFFYFLWRIGLDDWWLDSWIRQAFYSCMAFFDKGSCTRGCFDVCFLDIYICEKQTCLETRCSLNELLNRYMWLKREGFHLNLLGICSLHGYKCTKCKKIL